MVTSLRQEDELLGWLYSPEQQEEKLQNLLIKNKMIGKLTIQHTQRESGLGLYTFLFYLKMVT